MGNVTEKQIAAAFEKAVSNKKKEHMLKRELESCTKQIRDNLGIDVVIKTKEQYMKEKASLEKLSYKDVVSVSRTFIFPDKIETSVKFKDGTETKVVLNDCEDIDDKEKAIMWCLLKKTFSSKRGLEKIIYSLGDVE